MSTDYTNVDGYLVPSFALPTGSTPPLGKYGAMRARFLDEHRPFERDQMLLDGTLAQHISVRQVLSSPNALWRASSVTPFAWYGCC